MRFAYIDSQGNEVPIPSVDALALRIELGAIGPDTQLYDAQADRWGPAETHEIFHTLRRERSGDEGFVAPPPPVVPPPDGEGPAAEGPDSAHEEESEAAAIEEVEVPAGAEGEPGPAPDEAPEAEPVRPSEGGEVEGAAEEPSLDLSGDFELEATEPEEEAPPAEAPPSDGLGFDLELTADAAPPDAGAAPTGTAGEESLFGALDLAPETAEPPAGGESEDQGGFDFGDLGGLELEAAPFEEEQPQEESPAEAAPPVEEAAGGLGGGMELEQPLSDMGFAAGDVGAGGLGGGMELEQPMSEFTSEAPPSWMEEGPGAEADETAVEPAPGRSEGPVPPAPAEGAERRRAPTRSKPAPPRRKKKRSIVPLVMGVVGVAVVGGGGWFAWRALASRAAESVEAVPELPPVTIPEIPAELLPTMRDLGEQALADMIAELQSMQSEFDLPEGVNTEWLGGRYLANASQFPDIEQYWEGIESFTHQVQDRDQALFHEKYLARLSEAGITGDTADILLERADSGFKAAQVGRLDAYQLMDDLTTAALDLHDFLLDNEQEISYEPAAAGMSRDPVLEAVPSSRSLGNEMWDMVDRITGSLQALGTLDRVTTERLLAVLFDRIRRAGFQ